MDIMSIFEQTLSEAVFGTLAHEWHLVEHRKAPLEMEKGREIRAEESKSALIGKNDLQVRDSH